MPFLNLNVQNVGNKVRVTGIFAFNRKLNELEGVPGLREELDKIKRGSLYNQGLDAIEFTENSFLKINETIEAIKNKANAILDFFDASSPIQEDAIDIRLPDVTTFSEMEAVFKDLKTSIEVTLNTTGVDHNLKIFSAEPGSIWIKVALGSKIAVSLIGEICKKALDFRKELANAKITEQRLRMLKVNNDILESIGKNTVKLHNELTEKLSKDILSDRPNLEQAIVKQVAYSIDTIAQLMELGAKFLPESKDKSIVEAFPTHEQYRIPMQEQNKIENSSEL